MAANWELQLLSAILNSPERDDAFKYVLDQGVSIRHFGTTQAETIWAFLYAHYSRPKAFGRVPSLERVKERYKNLDLPKPVEDLEDILELVIDNWAYRSVTEHIEERWEQAEKGEALAALAKLLEGLNSVAEASAVRSDIRWRDRAMQDAMADLAAIESGEGMTGMPYPWKELNKATGGIQDGDFIILWAIPKSKKTWIGLYIAVNLFLLGYRVIIYSKEMMWKIIRRRLSCLIAQVDYKKYKENRLTDDEKFWLLHATALTTSDEFEGELIFTTCDKPDGSVGGPIEIQSKIDQYKPDFMMLDSSYMLEVPGVKDALDWKAIGSLTRQLKAVAKTTGTPLLGIFQENEQQAIKHAKTRGTASIAMYKGMVMDCDIGIKVVNIKKLDETSLILAACRETDFPGFTIHSKLCTDLGFKSFKLHRIGDDSEGDEEETKELELESTDKPKGLAGGGTMATQLEGASKHEIDEDIADCEAKMEGDKSAED